MPIRELVGHTSQDSAMLVKSYPYGRKLRCRIRFWIESDPKKGFRFVSQTEDPNSLVWNNPKKSTYRLLGMAMYQIDEPGSDEHNHVKHDCISQYDKTADMLAFVEKFPHAMLGKNFPAFVVGRKMYAKRTSQGEANWKIAGKPQLPSELDIAEAVQEIVVLDKILDTLRQRGLIGADQTQ